MKGLAFTVMFLVLATAIAAAKPVPVSKINPMEDLTPPPARNDVDINSGPAGACSSGIFPGAIAVHGRRPALPTAIGNL